MTRHTQGIGGDIVIVMIVMMSVMMHTAAIYRRFLLGVDLPDAEFTREYLPIWKKLDRFGSNNITRLSFAVLYTAVYFIFAPS